MSGCGKTHMITECLRSDAEKGIHSFLIVPEQQAVQSERHTLYSLPASAQLTLEVLNFSRLYNRVCREYGGLEYNYITKPMKHLLMWQNLRELTPLLEVYGTDDSSAQSLCDTMLSAVGEFKACGVSAAQLEAAAKKLSSDSAFAAKLRDLALIFSAYDGLVSQSFSDSADDLSRLCLMLSEHRFFAHSNVYIDSFTSYTAAEHNIINRIFLQADNVYVTVPLPGPDYEGIWTGSIRRSERKLIKAAADAGGYEITLLKTNHRTAESPSLGMLSESLWKLGTAHTHLCENQAVEKDAAHRIKKIICRTPYAEAEAAAVKTLELMRSGIRCRDIVVTMRDAESYRGIIEPAFERNGIPFYFSEKTSLASSPLATFILSALRIKNRAWQTTDVISHLRTGLYTLPRRSVDMFEQYITTWNVHGAAFTDGDFTMNPDGYTDRISERGAAILAAANDVRIFLCDMLIPFFTALEASENAAEMCAAVYDFTVRAGVRQTMSDIALREQNRGNIREAGEYSRIFDVTSDTLASAAEAFDHDFTQMDSAEFADALKIIFEQTEIGSIPTSADAVTIGSASMLRADNPLYVLVLGLRDGSFPAPVTDSGLLSFAEREQLDSLGISLSSDIETASSDELMFVQRAFSLPSQGLFLFTSVTGFDGENCRPSLPFERVSAVFPSVSTENYDCSDILKNTGSARNSIPYLKMLKGTPAAEALRRYCGISDCEAFRNAAEISSLPVCEPECRISAETAGKLFSARLNLTQSRLEKYIRCNFSYYCSYILKLRKDERASFRANDIGSFIHSVLENLLRNAVGEDGSITLPDDETLRKMTEAVVSAYIDRICPSSERDSGRLKHLYDRLCRLSLLLVRNIVREFSHSSFEPRFFELKTDGSGGNPSPLEFVLKNGSKVSMSGIIDRVDIWKNKDTNEIYIRVVDYKTGTKSFSLSDIKLGLDIQMLLYLFTLTGSRNQEFRRAIGADDKTGLLPAGVVYLSSNIPSVELEDYTDPSDVENKAEKLLDRSGLLLNDETVLRSMNDELSPDFLMSLKRGKDGSISGKSLVSAEDFEEIRRDIEKVITEISDEIISGKADAEPLCHNGTLPCDYCEMKPVCRKTEH